MDHSKVCTAYKNWICVSFKNLMGTSESDSLWRFSTEMPLSKIGSSHNFDRENCRNLLHASQTDFKSSLHKNSNTWFQISSGITASMVSFSHDEHHYMIVFFYCLDSNFMDAKLKINAQIRINLSTAIHKTQKEIWSSSCKIKWTSFESQQT